ncbi:MAG: NUDIX hydrolase [Actinocrinis sp.]
MAPSQSPAGYDARDWPPFAVTVDLVVLTVRDGALSALVIRRGEDPYAGCLALPGGFVRAAESLDRAAARELAEETGLARLPVHLEQLATYGTVDRDPRMRVISVAYLALAPDLPAPRAGGDAVAAAWTPVASVLPDLFPGAPMYGSTSAKPSSGPLAFDHGRILGDGVERARAKLEYSPLAAAFCSPEFTVGELRRVYEAVWGVVLDPRNFHRKVTGTPGFLVPVGDTTARQGGRPAQLFRLGDVSLLNPPMLRPS